MTSKGLVLDIPFNEESGTTASDLSRYKNNGTITAGAGHWSNNGYYFDGSATQILVTTAAQLQISKSLISLVVWIKTGTVSEMAIVDKLDDGDTPTLGYGLRTDAAGHAIFTTNTDEYDSATLISDNIPHFVAGVLDGTNKFIVVDDKVAITKAYNTAITDSAKNLGIGYQVNPEIRFTGTIYSVQIYNRGLTFGQLMSIYNNTKHNYI